MSGERDIATLLKDLSVKRHTGVWRIETESIEEVSEIDPAEIAIRIREREGETLYLPVRADTPQQNRWVWLELAVHSDLNAVGFLAVIANALANVGVPCNAVAGYFHDHIFVPEDKAQLAIDAIERLSV